MTYTMNNIATISTGTESFIASIPASVSVKSYDYSTINDYIKNIIGEYSHKTLSVPTKRSQDLKNKQINDSYRKKIKWVKFNDQKKATTVMWSDNTVTVVKLSEGDTFDPYVGIAMCIAKKYFGNRPIFNEIIQHWGDTYKPSNIEKDEPKKKVVTRKVKKVKLGE